MYPPAPGDFAYNQNVFYYGVKVTQTVGTALNIWTLLMIWKFSHKDMMTYRNHLLVYQIASTTIDFSFDFFCQGIFFFPYIAGSCQGWMRTVFGLNSYEVFVVMITLIPGLHYLVTYHLIFYRWQIILKDDHWMKIKSIIKRYGVEAAFIVVSATGMPIFFRPAVENEEIVKEEFRQTFPNDSDLSLVDGFYWVNVEKHQTVIAGIAWASLWTITSTIIISSSLTSCINELKKMKDVMSKKTKELHVKFLKSISVQVAIPLAFFNIPLVLILLKVMLETRFGHQNLNNFLTFTVSTHGSIASISILAMNSCYTKATRRIILYPFKSFLPKAPQPKIQPQKVVESPSSIVVSTITTV